MDSHDYDPIVFLRCHSNSSYDRETDIHTKVWHTEFQPHSSNIVATAGGYSICFIDVNEGKVKKKYKSTDTLENFYCLTWTEVSCNEFDSVTLLVAGSSAGKLHIIHFEEDKAVSEITLEEKISRKKKNGAINCLCVYKDENNRQLLLCGLAKGIIKVLDLKCTKQDSSVVCDWTVLGSLNVQSEVLQIAFCSTTQTILAACSEGLMGCHVPSEEHIKNNNHQTTKFVLTSEFHKKGKELTDTVEVIGDGLVCVKYALHGVIYVFDLKYTLDHQKKFSAVTEYTPKYKLEWSDTDNYYLNIGVSKAANLLACGDDKGAIWVYNIESLKNGGVTTPEIMPPVTKIEWPIVKDKYASKKLKLDTYDIVVNKVAIHSSGQFIVAVTDNNTVCLWKRVDT